MKSSYGTALAVVMVFLSSRASVGDEWPGVRPGEEAFEAFHGWIRRRVAGAVLDGAGDREGRRLASRRREELVDLIESDPRRAVELALPDSVRAGLPATVAALVEERVSGRGDLEVLCALPEAGAPVDSMPLRRWVRMGGRKYEAFVSGRRLGAPTRRGISVHGIVVDGRMAVAESPVRRVGMESARVPTGVGERVDCAFGGDHPAGTSEDVVVEVFGERVRFCGEAHAAAFEAGLVAEEEGRAAGGALAASPAAEGAKRMIFIRVDFSDLQGEPIGTNRAQELVRELDRFFRESSYGRAGFAEIGVGSDVTPVFRLPRTAADYGANDDAGDLRSDARAAARAAGYDLAAYDYDVTFLKNVPGFGWAGLGYVGAPGAWIRGTTSAGVTAHELGHNLGLNHANFWDTGGRGVIGDGESIEYGDKFDTMGAANAGRYHFNARYKRLLGWLKSGEFTVATTNGSYRIHAHDRTNAVAGSRGLQVFANARTNYWLEYRQGFTNNPWMVRGVGVRWTGRGNESSLLLDTTPGSPGEKDDAALGVGRTFSDPVSAVHLTPVDRGGTDPAWVDVVVHRGSFAGNRAPEVSISTSAVSGATGATFEFRAEATDPDGDALAYYWEFGDDDPGRNAAEVSHRWSAAGDYVVRCTVSDMKGGVGIAQLPVRVGSSGTHRVSGRVTADGEPVVGVRVSAGSSRQGRTASDGTFVLTGLSSGSHTLTAVRDEVRYEPVTFANPVRVSGSLEGLDFAAVDRASRRSVTLVPAGSVWRYWDGGTFPGSGWTLPGFDDAGWDAGPAILGYGGDRETTVIDFGESASRKHITAWFRRSFTVADPAALTGLRLGLLRDDGAVVYLNGREWLRDNMPAGTIGATTRASSAVGGADETTYFEHELEADGLVAGTNVLAVEVHQSGPTSSDTAFDLRLTADEIREVEPGIHLVRPVEGEAFEAGQRIVLSAVVGEAERARLRRVDFRAGDEPIGSATNAPFSMTWRSGVPGVFRLSAEAVLHDGLGPRSPVVGITVSDAALRPVLIPRGAVWRYWDGGVAPASTWTQVDFDDGGWREGAARLGYGEDGEVTVVDFGPDSSRRHVTTWFRHRFAVSGASTVTNLVARLQRDDGAAVYLNGRELFRLGLRSGVLGPTVLAQSEIRDDAEQVFTERTLPPTGLVDGWNVVSVEVHQASVTSSDLGFDFELLGNRSARPEMPRLSARWSGGRVVLRWPASTAGWRLESATDLGAVVRWSPVPGEPESIGEEVEVVVETTGSAMYFRLVGP